MDTSFYVYAYLRNRSSEFGDIGTPYYIGKGRNMRLYSKNHFVAVPTDEKLIVKLYENLSESKSLELEMALIKEYGRQDLGTGILLNRTNGGDGVSGYIATPEYRTKLSKARIGKTFRPHSEEAKQKISRSKTGTTLSIDTKLKMSEAGKRKIFSAAHKENIRKAKLGTVLSAETRKKISDARKKAIDRSNQPCHTK